MSDTQLDLLAEPLSDGLAARTVALSILTQVLGQKKMLDSVLDRDAAFLALPARDRAFVRMMVATSLRRRGQLDELIARATDKGEPPRPETLRWILYLGLTQILFMDVPDHAAVDTAVTLTAQQSMDGKKGFVNAVLRRMTGEGKYWLEQQDAAALNIPGWLYLPWINAYGAAKAKEIALASLEEAALDISLKNPADAALWADRLAADILPTGSLRRKDGGHVTDLMGFHDGDWWVQDASSALPARLFGDVAGKKVLDLCAAPGGKTAQLAAMGAHVVAVDRSAARMKLLKENLDRLHLSDHVETVIEDGSEWRPRDSFDYILLDAPCTATGTIRRHPDLLSLKTDKDQAGLVSIQERLLRNAGEILAPGGTLIYCTCSLQKAEGEDQVNRFLSGSRSFQRGAVQAEEVGGLADLITADGDVRVLPCHLKDQGGLDGFYIARLRKNV